MAHGPIYRVPLRRRREGKTNYYKRRDMLKSGRVRLIIRRTPKHMRVQFVEAYPNGDKTLSATISTQLSKFKWNISCGNIPAAYLTGYLAGKKALKAGVTDAILDLGLQSSTRGSRIYATLKGLIDAGVQVPSDESIFPSEDVIKGSHIKTISEHQKKDDAKKFKQVYAKYHAAKVKPEKLADFVSTTKGEIDKL
ncbi:MAG: 50S ribosomal protein L18 [Candidatus Heimdallarchaeota archaeon]